MFLHTQYGLGFTLYGIFSPFLNIKDLTEITESDQNKVVEVSRTEDFYTRNLDLFIIEPLI